MVDFEKHRDESLADFYRTGGSAHAGVTVRDYFAIRVLPILIEKYDETPAELVVEAYEWADAMMRWRDGKAAKQCTVEEAFGL